jgi:hypothetical protein
MHLSGYAKFKSDVVKAGDLIGYSGGETESFVKNYSSGPHIHVQAKRGGVVQRLTEKDGTIIVNLLTTNVKPIDNPIVNRLTTEATGGIKDNKILFTTYNPQYEQTDASPCVGSRANVCELWRKGQRPIALPVATMKSLGIKYFDNIRIVSDNGQCNITAVVVDTMNRRYNGLPRGDIFVPCSNKKYATDKEMINDCYLDGGKRKTTSNGGLKLNTSCQGTITKV